MHDYEVSAVYMEGVVATIRDAGFLDAVAADVSPQSQAVLKNPWSDNWHRAWVLEDIGAAVVKVAGEAFFTDIGYRNARNRFGPIILPMMNKALASGTASPVLLLGGLDASVKVAMRGFECVWKSTGENAGTLTVTYPRKVGAQVDLTWRGVFRFIFEVFKKTHVVEGIDPYNGNTVIVYRLSWQ